MEIAITEAVKKRICIATVDTIGPIKNGGIGTACFALAKELAGDLRFDVSILYTGHFHSGSEEEWKEYYRNLNIKFISLRSEMNSNSLWQDYLTERSNQVYEYLRRASFDVVHFQDWQADGFVSIRAKKLGIALQNSLLTVTLHSPTRWQREGMQLWPNLPIADMKQDFLEQYCCENADILISPSQHMFEWARLKNWKIQDERCILAPYCSPLQTSPSATNIGSEFDLTHLIFFGRLETRKGLEIFCEALSIWASESPDSVREISFYGKHSFASGISSQDYLRRFSSTLPEVKVNIYSEFDSFTALQKIRDSRGIVFMPSLLDNYPLTIIECIELGIPFFAAATGGIPEIVAPEAKFDPTSTGILEKLRGLQHCSKRIYSLHHKYDANVASSKWKDVSLQIPPMPRNTATYTPLVSIIVSYFNLGKYLPETLDSLDQNSYQNFEVIVVNDGSTDPASVAVFEEESNSRGSRYKFVTTENSGPGAARNFGVSLSSGEYVLFVDADNIPTPTMIENLAHGIICSGSDIVTCFLKAFEGDFQVSRNQPPLYVYQPLGPCLEAGLFENVFGDTNFIARKHVFEALGGFPTERSYAHEDWEFLANAAIKGIKLEVYPDFVCWYRHRPNSHIRVTSELRNRQLSARPYLVDLPIHIQRILLDAALPLSRKPDFASSRSYKVAQRASRLLSRVTYLKCFLIFAFDELRRIKNWVRKKI